MCRQGVAVLPRPKAAFAPKRDAEELPDPNEPSAPKQGVSGHTCSQIRLITDSSVQPLYDRHSPSSKNARWFAAVGQTCGNRSLVQRAKPRTHLRRPSPAYFRRFPPPCAPDPRWQDWLQAPDNLNQRYSQSLPGSCCCRRRANPGSLQSCACARHGGGVQG